MLESIVNLQSCINSCALLSFGRKPKLLDIPETLCAVADAERATNGMLAASLSGADCGISLKRGHVKQAKIVSSIAFGFDQDHEVLPYSQVFWMANFVALAIAHFDSEWNKRGGCQ